MPADNEHDPLDRWLNQQVRPLPPPPGTFELITRRARRRKLRKAAVSVASAAAVAAAVAVAVPLGPLAAPDAHAVDERQPGGGQPARRAARGSPSTLGTGTKEPTASASGGTALRARRAGTAGRDHARVPAAQLPALLGDLGLAEHRLDHGARRGHPAIAVPHQDSAICTSIARTSDGGQHLARPARPARRRARRR